MFSQPGTKDQKCVNDDDDDDDDETIVQQLLPPFWFPITVFVGFKSQKECKSTTYIIVLKSLKECDSNSYIKSWLNQIS